MPTLRVVIRKAQLIASALLVLSACSDSASEPATMPSDAATAADGAARDSAVDRERGVERPGFCDREGADAVRDAFCAEVSPTVRGLRDLQQLLSVDPTTQNAEPSYPAPIATLTPDGITRVVILGHSTALSGHKVSPINPRAIVLAKDTVMAFQRGVQRVELASLARDGELLNFYLVDFEQACNARDAGCSAGELYTPQIESDWTGVSVRDDEDLKNTPLDCRQCHQRDRNKPTLLMRELQSPWTHFFFPLGSADSGPGVHGSDLMSDYLDAKGEETYAGFDLDGLGTAAPFALQTTVDPAQPLLFDAPTIESESRVYDSDGHVTERLSPTWERGYEAFKRGEQLALPYAEPRASDPDKQARLTAAYQRFRQGELDADELPDLSDVFPDDPQLRARIGLQTEPDATPQDALIQACGSCHNDVLDQSISRARFNIDLSQLDRAELDLAIDRIERRAGTSGVMPPPEARQLDPDTRARLLTYLRDDLSATKPDKQLQRAAKLGMAGGANPGPVAPAL